jgi:hypothetical protein
LNTGERFHEIDHNLLFQSLYSFVFTSFDAVYLFIYFPKKFHCAIRVLSPIIVRVINSRRMRYVGHVARLEEGRGVYRLLVGRPEGKRPLGRPRRTWENNIKMDLRTIGIDGANWIRLAQDRFQWRAFVNTVMNLRVQ